MLSSDREILIEIAGRVTKIEQEITDTRAEMKTLAQEQEIIRHDIASLQTSVYWTLAAIGIFLGTVAIIPLIAAVIALFKFQSKQEPDIDELARRVALKLGNIQQ